MVEKDTIVYEQPLNEKVRTFLRLEYLFNLVNYHTQHDSEWDNRNTISNLLNIVDLLSRSDLKAELIKELERHSSTLQTLKNNPNANQERIISILENIDLYLTNLRDQNCQPGHGIKQSELITSIKQRSTIPGGSCNFDLPSYHFWLNRPYQTRLDDINKWRSDLKIMQESLKFVLFMLRNSTSPTQETANSGFFQQPIESNMSCQLIRIVLPRNTIYYPEISGGKHRFTVRFLIQEDSKLRSIQTKDPVEFELHCCIL